MLRSYLKICLILTFVTHSQIVLAESVEQKAKVIFGDFLDLKKPGSWSEFVNKWVDALKSKADYKEFCTTLEALKNSTSGVKIAAGLLRFKSTLAKIDTGLLNYLEKNQNKVLDVLKKRIGK